MKAVLKILYAEDSPADAKLTHSRLQAAGIKCRIIRAETEQDFKAVLCQPDLDLILSDFSMPRYDGMSALRASRKQRPEVPFIFLSGTLGEDVAIEALKEGATDYVLKDRMSRLPTAVRRALRDAGEGKERQRMEVQIREQAELLDRAQDAIYLNDMAQRILYWNKSAARLYGWNAREAIGKHADNLLSLEDQCSSVEALHSLIRKSEWKGELHQITRDNREIIVESRWTLIRDDHDKPKSILIISTDITEKKQIEAQFLRNQRVETIGALAGGIAHDLNNTLSPILMAASLLRPQITTPEGQKLLDMMSASARRGSEMVKQILSFSRGVGGTHGPVQIEPIVLEMSQLASKTFPCNINIETTVAKALPAVFGNPTQLHQVLLNLCVNARDAMPKGGSLTIDASSVELDTSRLPEGLGLQPGQYVTLKVTDTGEGIPNEIRKKIFEPFFSTKEAARGTGLGLSTVMGIVKTHGGFLEVASKVGRGTTFKVHLPAVEIGLNN